MQSRTITVPCLPSGSPLVRQTADIPLTLIVACDHFVHDMKSCRGACSAGLVASADACAVCTSWVAPKSMSLVHQVKTLAAAVASGIIQEIATPEVQAQRLDLCRVCPFLDPSTVEGEVGHCLACGCRKGKLSELTNKAKIRYSTCPKKIWDGLTYANPPSSYPPNDVTTP